MSRLVHMLLPSILSLRLLLLLSLLRRHYFIYLYRLSFSTLAAAVLLLCYAVAAKILISPSFFPLELPPAPYLPGSPIFPFRFAKLQAVLQTVQALLHLYEYSQRIINCRSPRLSSCCCCSHINSHNQVRGHSLVVALECSRVGWEVFEPHVGPFLSLFEKQNKKRINF